MGTESKVKNLTMAVWRSQKDSGLNGSLFMLKITLVVVTLDLFSTSAISSYQGHREKDVHAEPQKSKYHFLIFALS